MLFSVANGIPPSVFGLLPVISHDLCVTKHLFTGGYAQLTQNIVIMIFQRAFLDARQLKDLFCAFSRKLIFKNISLGFRKSLKSGKEITVILRVYLRFA